MATYNDLFKLSPKPQEVITMDEAIVYNQDEVINNYVITSNIKDKFKKILHHLTLDKGKGFWIQGAYGSGKSHFMSYLTILLNSSKYWNNVSEEIRTEYKPKISQRNYLTVNFTLSEVNNLKVKIFDEIERAFQDKGINLTIKKDQKIVEQFLKDEYEGLKKDWFFKTLKDKCNIDSEDWKENLSEMNIPGLAAMIVRYKQVTGAFGQKEYREIIYPSTREGLEQITSILYDHFDGLVIFIDELSEFLQKKKARQEELESLETLQTLGQRIIKSPIWVLAAVQKNPAEIIDEEIYTGDEEEKVFDRFEPITLSEADIEEIIDRRIIIKNENQKKNIKAVYKDLKNSKPNLQKNISEEKFIKLYPFHNQFVSSLIFLSTYGSRQRAAVRECWEIVNNRLNTPAEELITIDVLYDTFEDDIIHDHFKPYYDLYQNLFKETIIKPGFDHDRELSQRIIKALIIYAIRRKEPLASKDISELLMADLGLKMGLSLINNKIENILKDLNQEVKGKGMEMIRDEQDGKEIYYWEINPGTSGVNIESEILAETRHLNENDVMIEITGFINKNHHLFKNFEIYQDSRKMDQGFNWRNTERYGLNYYKKLKEGEKLKKIDPVNQEVDFGLILEVPLFENHNTTIKNCKEFAGSYPRYIFWVPKNLNQETINDLKRLVAVKRLLSNYSDPSNDEEVQKNMRLKTEKDKLREKIDKEIESTYLSGAVITKNKIIDELEQFTGIKDLIEHCLNNMLDDIYPRHPRFKKEISRRQTNALIRNFIIPRASQEYSNEIENVAEPLKLVTRESNIYKLDLQHEIFEVISKKLTGGEWYSIEEIYRDIRQKPWGIQEYGFEAIIAALIANGEIRAIDNNEEIITSETFNRNYLKGGFKSKLEAVSKGKLVNSVVWDEISKLFEIYKLDFLDKKNNINQDKNWSRLVDHALKLKNEIDSTQKHFFELAGKLGQFEEFKNKLTIFKKFSNFFTNIQELKDRESDYGLEEYRKILLDEFNKIDKFKTKYYQLQKILNMADERIDNKLLNLYFYFDQIESENVNMEEVENIKNGFGELCNIIDNPNKVKNFLSRAEDAKEKYQHVYIKDHNSYHNKYKEFIQKIKSLSEYNVLSSLGDIKKIAISPDLEQKIENIKKNFSQICELNITKENIEIEPTCNCSYQLGEKFQPLSLEKVKEDLINGIKEYFHKLKSDNFKEQIELYIEKNPNSRLIKLNNIAPYEIDKIKKIVDDQFILEINEAFKSAYPVHVSLKEIKNIFQGTIPSTEINITAEKVKKYLIARINKEIEDNDEIEFERVVLFIKDEVAD